MPTLKVLHLCRNQKLTRVKALALSGLINLEELHMSDNIALEEIDPMALAMVRNHTGGAIWPPIKKLHISNNKLAYLDSDVIARWDFLKELDIRGEPVDVRMREPVADRRLDAHISAVGRGEGQTGSLCGSH
ncbi:hypothetical protein NQ315_010907 [Exocentrus adspersus]|uniref:Uncharacterized protein n=1 Tax=Exocentrus adspersus TaxID=1586481 RepID=A0AAV8VP95_9CUCU|nr:hypothetical protein NQ315_010907 [Exocentrus adspersus]